jgi:hypothetical protein
VLAPSAVEALVAAVLRSGDEKLTAAVLSPIRAILGEAMINAAILQDLLSG